MAITITYEADRRIGLVERVRRYLAVRRIEGETFAELNGLSDRDLADIGLSRHALRDVARVTARTAR